LYQLVKYLEIIKAIDFKYCNYIIIQKKRNETHEKISLDSKGYFRFVQLSYTNKSKLNYIMLYKQCS